MSESKMQNPYEKDGVAHSEAAFGRGAACAVIAAFVLILLLPPLYRNVYEASVGGEETWVPVVEVFDKSSDKTITGHLKAFEKELEDKADFTEPPRQFVQGALSGSFREGNRKTFIGRDGWLYLQAALDAMSGYGPIDPEPDSVAKDPNREPWNAPFGAIKTFAAQLQELGVPLVLVPIPVKPMIYPEGITGATYTRPQQHRDAQAFYAELEALPNVHLIDLSQGFFDLKTTTPVFLKQDTHWTSSGMSFAAQSVAREVASLLGLPTDALNKNPGTKAIEVKNIGDLAEQLNLPGDGTQWFLPETQIVQPVPDFTSDPTAGVTLLGDSFTNIYSQKSLNWGEAAGFAEHLAFKLGQPLDVIAINGQASTKVRSELTKRGKTHLEKKKVVVWAIAARDLFLSETAARENNVLWHDVEIPDIPDSAEKPSAKPPEAIDVTGVLLSKSEIADPNTVTYKNAQFVSEFEVVDGLDTETVLVTEWAFREKKLTSASQRKIGEEVSFRLVPFKDQERVQKELKGEQTFDQYDEPIERLYEARYWPVAKPASGEAEPENIANPKRATLFASLACVIAVLSVGVGAGKLARR